MRRHSSTSYQFTEKIFLKRKRESGAKPELSRSGNLVRTSPYALAISWEAATSRNSEKRFCFYFRQSSSPCLTKASKSEYLPGASEKPQSSKSWTSQELFDQRKTPVDRRDVKNKCRECDNSCTVGSFAPLATGVFGKTLLAEKGIYNKSSGRLTSCPTNVDTNGAQGTDNRAELSSS